ncbi:MAG: ORF6N domain-containing protein [Thermoplasmata archaeon]
MNEQVRRNRERFPEEFMFQLTEHENLRFQIGTSSDGEILKSQFVTSSRSRRDVGKTGKEIGLSQQRLVLRR